MFSNIFLAAAVVPLAYANPFPFQSSPRAANGSCADMTVVFARGTTETGDLGTLVGPPFQAALNAAMGSASVNMMGVPAPAYTADVPGFLAGGSATESQAMAQMVSSAMTACPNTKMVISGYSQGGQLVHNAAKSLPASTMSQVSAAVIFGDPDNGTAVAGVSAAKTMVICHDGDNICAHGDLILDPYLTYGTLNSQQAASFVKAQSGL